MQVLDYQESEWILFEDGEMYILEANCNHSFIGYIVAIELNESEKRSFVSRGRDFLTELARDIHNSVPILKESDSVYKNRNVHKKYSELTSQAVKEWRDSFEKCT